MSNNDDNDIIIWDSSEANKGGGFLELLGYWMDKVGLLRVMLITEVVVTAKTMETQI